MDVGLNKVSRTETFAILNQINGFMTSERSQWLKECMENEEFEVSKQWSAEEIAENEDRGNYVITINVIERVIEYITGMLTAKLPEYNVYPKNRQQENATKLGKKVLSWIFEENRGLMKIRKWVHDGLVSNLSHLFVYPDEDGMVRISNLSYDEVIIDPASKDFTWSDARAIYIKKKISIADAKTLYGITDFDTGFPDEYGQLKQNIGSSSIVPGGISKTNYEYSTTEIFRVFSSDLTYMDIYEKYSKQLVNENGRVKTRIIKEILLGYDHVLKEVLPECIDTYPIVSFFYKDTKNPYKIGKVHLIKEIQRFINKIHGLILKNTLSLGSPKVFTETTAIPNGNIEEFRKSLSDPAGLVLTNPSLSGREQIKTVQASPAPPAPMELYHGALSVMEFNTAPKEAIGMSDSNNASASILQKEAILDSFKTMGGLMEDALERLGVIQLQYAKAYVKEDMIVYVSDGNEVMQKLELNKAHKLDFNNPESIESFKKKMREEGMSSSEVENILVDAKSNEDYANSIQEYIQNSTSHLDFFVKIVPGSYTHLFDSLKFHTLSALVDRGSIHPSILIDYAPLEDKEKIKQKSETMERAFSEMRDMGQQLEQAMQELDKIQKENEKLQKDMVENRNKVRMDYLYKDARVKEAKAKNDLQLSIKNKKSETSIKAQELILEVKQALKEIEEREEVITQDEADALREQLDQIINQTL